MIQRDEAQTFRRKRLSLSKPNHPSLPFSPGINPPVWSVFIQAFVILDARVLRSQFLFRCLQCLERAFLDFGHFDLRFQA